MNYLIQFFTIAESKVNVNILMTSHQMDYYVMDLMKFYQTEEIYLTVKEVPHA